MSTTTFSVPFDTLAFVRELETAGVPPAQAEAQVKAFTVAIRQVENSRKDELATRGDILRLDGKIDAVKVDIIKWTASMFVAQTALIIGAMFAVMKMNQPIVPAYQQPAQEMRQTAPVPPPVAAQPTAPPPAK